MKVPSKTSSSTKTPKSSVRASQERLYVYLVLLFIYLFKCPHGPLGVRTGNFPREGSAGIWHQDGRRRFPEEGWPDAPRLASVRVCEGGISYLRHLGHTAAKMRFLIIRPFARPNPTQRSCTCRRRTLPTRSSKQSRTRLASLCALRRAFPKLTKSEYVNVLLLVPTR